MLGKGVDSTITVRPITPGTNKLVWHATGDPMILMRDSRKIHDEGGYYITLPVVDQDGWLDASGQEYKNWNYEATIIWGANRSNAETKRFQVFSGQTHVDLDLIFNGTAGMPTTGDRAVVTALAGLTGNVTQEQLEGLGLGGSTPIAPHPTLPGVLVIGE